MNWYLAVVKKYAVFSGRARRKEYWMFALINFLFIFVAMFLDRLLGTTFNSTGSGFIYLLYSLGIFLPSLAVGFRRLHDTGRSGWFGLIALIPLIGAIWLLVILCSEGDATENKYGMNPKLAG